MSGTVESASSADHDNLILVARDRDALYADWKLALATIGDLSERLLRADSNSWQEAMLAADARRQQARSPLT